MPWWGWIVVGTLLLGAELFVIPTDFFLVFLGTSAIAVGAIAWTGLVGSASVEWLLFAALSVISLVFFRARFAPGVPALCAPAQLLAAALIAFSGALSARRASCRSATSAPRRARAECEGAGLSEGA